MLALIPPLRLRGAHLQATAIKAAQEKGGGDYCSSGRPKLHDDRTAFSNESSKK